MWYTAVYTAVYWNRVERGEDHLRIVTTAYTATVRRFWQRARALGKFCISHFAYAYVGRNEIIDLRDSAGAALFIAAISGFLLRQHIILYRVVLSVNTRTDLPNYHLYVRTIHTRLSFISGRFILSACLISLPCKVHIANPRKYEKII